MEKILKLLYVILMLTITIGTVSAAVVADTLYVNDASGENGENVIVPINVNGANDLAALQLKVLYDKDVITANSAITGEFATDNMNNGKTVIYASNIDNTVGYVTVGFACAGTPPDTTACYGTGTLAKITFHVIGNPGDTSPLDLSVESVRGTSETGTITTTTNGTFTVTGQTQCTITAPEDITAEATGPTTAVSLGTASVNCGAGAIVTNNAPAGGFPVGKTTVTWTVTGTGTSTDTQLVTITDKTPPKITIIGDNPVTVQVGNAYTDAGATATDLVDGTVNVITSGTVDTNTAGQYPITYTATDAAGNTATKIRTVNVVSGPPECTISAPEDITKSATGTLTYVDLGTPTTSNCDSPIVTNDAPASGFPVGTTIVTWTVAYGDGKTASDTQLVTITPQTTQLTIVAPPDITKVATGSLTTIANLGTPTVTGGTPPYNTVNDAPAEGFPVGTTTVTWTVTDKVDKTASDTQLVIITEKPIPPPPIPELDTIFLTSAGLLGIILVGFRNRR
jgi:hypothetical protein